ncbi:MAG: hypothetical protein H6739_40395 [Alphaproteobacteria bacterium]|nr:hypothetical protein [Alphaproteobacteria bacterium]
MRRMVPATFAVICFLLLVVPGFFAPEHLSEPDLSMGFAGPGAMPPFGADGRGRPLLEYALQGSRVVAMPSIIGGAVVALFGVVGGLLACTDSNRAAALVQAFGEVVGALPRMVVVLVVALLLPADVRGLLPIALTWAVLAAPGAMDEAASVAGRLGGARFVEALRAHGFSRVRIYLYHIVGLNLRPVVVRQGVEVMMQVVFLEIALSYLAIAESQPSFTHSDSTHSWAEILDLGYKVALDLPTWHALGLGLGLMAMVAAISVSVSLAVRAR